MQRQVPVLILLITILLIRPGTAIPANDSHSGHPTMDHSATEKTTPKKDPHSAHSQAAHEDLVHAQPVEDPQKNHFQRAAEVVAANQVQVEVVEKIGQHIPLDIVLIDVTGTAQRLETLLSKPTILAQIYYTCPGACSLIQGNLAHALNKAPYNLGEEYDVISISFDDTETPEHARKAAETYRKIIAENPNRDSWRFFTATADNIARLTGATGFKYFKRGPQDFIHPNLVTVISGDGLIIRYLYGTEYLPFDIGMALSEAHKGTPGVSIKKFLSYCFEYDPEKKTYAFSLFKISGAVILTLLAVFLFFLLRRGKATTPPSE